MKKFLWVLSAVVSAALFLASIMGWVDISVLEALGFISGGYSVWLLVAENIWTWPVSIANALIFIILFLETRLYADSGLQIVYIVLNVAGWYWWLKGDHGNKVDITHARWKGLLGLLGLTVVAGAGLYFLLIAVNDSAPLLDAVATILSLAATYMAIKKYLENWYVWIIVNLIYVTLYVVKDLKLLALLYIIYLAMTFVGLVDWRKQFNRLKKAQLPA